MKDFESFKEYLFNGNLEGVRNKMRVGFVNKIVDDDGQLPIHIACDGGFVQIVKLLLDNCCNIECENEWGMRPIHNASRNGNIEIVKLLLKRKCLIDPKDILGNTALDWAKMYDKTDCAELIRIEELFAAIKQNDLVKFDELYTSSDLFKQNFSTGLSVLETAIKSNADKIIKSILEKPTTNKEINDLMVELTTKSYNNIKLMKEYVLYLCIIHQQVREFKKFISSDVINGKCGLVGLSFLEIASENGCDAFIDDIMKKTIYNETIWINAIEKANAKGFVEIQKEISERMILIKSRQKVNFTLLHTAVCDNDADMVEYIVDHPNIVDLNSNNETLGTALALAYSLHHRKCIEVLQQYQLDTNTRNKYSQTPLHEAIASGLSDNCEYLIGRSVDIDWFGFFGLTALHCATIRGMKNVCEQLLNRSANYVRCVELTYRSSTNEITIPFYRSNISLTKAENALTFSMKFHRTLFSCFIDRLDSRSSNVHDGDNNSLLHLAVKCLKPGLCRTLLKAGAQVDSINVLGNTPLLEIFCSSQLTFTDKNLHKMTIITSLLIKSGANVHIRTSSGRTVFQLAKLVKSEKLMLALVSNDPELRNFSEIDFLSAFINQWFDYAEILIRLLPDNFLSSNITTNTFSLCKKAETKLINLLFDKSSSDLQQIIIEDYLYYAVNNADINLFEHFIKTEILAPKIFKNGENLFTFILKEKKIQFAWKILDSVNQAKFVNLKNNKNQIPLQFAIGLEEMDLIDALIHESEGFDCEDANGETVLTQLMGKISSSTEAHYKAKMISVIKSAIILGGDIHKITTGGQPIIDSCKEVNAKAEIERFHTNNIKKFKRKKHDNEKGICNICTDNHVDIVFQCGHLCCSACAHQITFCPYCKIKIVSRTKMYLI